MNCYTAVDIVWAGNLGHLSATRPSGGLLAQADPNSPSPFPLPPSTRAAAGHPIPPGSRPRRHCSLHSPRDGATAPPAAARFSSPTHAAAMEPSRPWVAQPSSAAAEPSFPRLFSAPAPVPIWDRETAVQELSAAARRHHAPASPAIPPRRSLPTRHRPRRLQPRPPPPPVSGVLLSSVAQRSPLQLVFIPSNHRAPLSFNSWIWGNRAMFFFPVWQAPVTVNYDVEIEFLNSSSLLWR